VSQRRTRVRGDGSERRAASCVTAGAGAGGKGRQAARDADGARRGAGLAQRPGAPQRPCGRVRPCILAAVGGEPAGEFLLIPFGEVGLERAAVGEGFVFTDRHARSAVDWFARVGRKLAIDYEHQSFDKFNTRADGLRPAAGWIGGLEVRHDGLWAVGVTWTRRAEALLRSGEYRYFSPVIYWTDEDCSDIAGLGPVALTNDPAMHGVRPLAATRRAAGVSVAPPGLGEEMEQPSEEQQMESDGARAAGEVEFEEEEACPEAEDWEPPGASVSAAALRRAEEEIALLRRRLAAQEADAFIERGMRLGKIVDATSMDWREDYLRDAKLTSQRLSRAPVLLPPGRVVKLDERGQPARLVLGRSGAGTRAQSGGVEALDLEAYERAVAAGRVRRAGLDG
jgi:phage I-like protein